MPMEGQWRRSATPIARRDRRLIFILAALAAVGSVAAIVIALTRGSSHAGCVTVTVASTMGGATVRHCGADARRFCRQQPQGGSIAAQCARLGYPVRRA